MVSTRAGGHRFPVVESLESLESLSEPSGHPVVSDESDADLFESVPRLPLSSSVRSRNLLLAGTTSTHSHRHVSLLNS